MKSTIPAATLLIFLSSCSPSGGCGGLFKGSGNVGVPVTVQNIEVRMSSPIVTVMGTLIPSDRAEITLPNSAKIDKVFVQEGDVVAAGSPLLRISEEEINSRLVGLRASRREAEAVLEKNLYFFKNRDKLLEEGKIEQIQYSGLDKEVTANEASLDRLKTEISSVEAELEKTTILSPINGIVVKKSVTDGVVASPNQGLLSIVNVNPILVSFPLTADESPGLQIGLPVDIKIDELGGVKYTAAISYIAPELHQPGKTFDVWASILNPDQVLKAGMRAFASFRSTKQHKIFIVPTSALLQRGNKVAVFVVKDGLAKETSVTPKEITKESATILDGLTEQDLIVVKGGDKLQDGTPVDIWR